MKRYIKSFIIASIIYSICSAFIFCLYFFNNIIVEKTNISKTLSLNHIELKSDIVSGIENSNIEEKKEIIKDDKNNIIKHDQVVKNNIHKQKNEEIIKDIKENKVVQQNIPFKNQENEIKEIDTINEEKIYLDNYLAQIRNLINQNIKYPNRARKLSVEGVVIAKFKLEKDGTVNNIIILKGHDFLKNSTIEAIIEASKLFPKASKSIEIQIPIEYKLI